MEKTHKLKRLKAKNLRLHNKRLQSIAIDAHEANLSQGEIPSVFHLLQMRKRHVSRMITSAIDKDVVTQTTTRDILHTFEDFLQNKYDPIQLDDACVTEMEKAVHRNLLL
jgi:DNA-binding transcriptional regulator LsrR (DeoR family)